MNSLVVKAVGTVLTGLGGIIVGGWQLSQGIGDLKSVIASKKSKQ